MSQAVKSDSDKIKEGLARIREISEASRTIDDPQLVARARQAVQTQVARLAAFKPDTIRWDAANTLEIPGQLRYVTSPTTPPTTTEPGNWSGVTVFFDAQGSHTNTVEAVFTQHSATEHQLQIWNDGRPVFDKTIEEGALRPEFSWDVLNSCLSNAGIAMGTVALIGFACSVACLEPAAPVLCPACIAALGVDTGGTIGWCIGKAIDS